MPRYFNFTFISLILKVDFPTSHNDFSLISICKSLYKIVIKVIAVRHKLILSREYLLGTIQFLKGRLIHEAIDLAPNHTQYSKSISPRNMIRFPRHT